MANEVTKKEDFSAIELVVMQGDLSKLTAEQRLKYYNSVCESAGLNPLTNPFAYIQLNGKLTLYAKKDCTEQLRKINGVSIEGLDDKIIDDLYIVKARAKDKTGRLDESTGAVVIGGLKGEQRANAIMKAETKAKRRVTLSICGMGWVDESEIDSIPNAKPIPVDLKTGEIIEAVKQEAKTEVEGLIGKEELLAMTNLLKNLDEECNKSFLASIKTIFNATSLQEIPKSGFEKCMTSINNKIKYLNDKNKEHMEIAV
jgi:hypothetical protein